MSNTPTRKTDSKSEVADQAKATAEAASEKLKSSAQDVANTVATEAAGYADQAKGAAADEVNDVASALRAAADELRSGSSQERTFSQIADGLADASEAVRDKDLGEIVGTLNDYAKRNPIVFLGSAALIGFAATRFAKASSDGASRSARSGYRSDTPAASAHATLSAPTSYSTKGERV